MTSETNSFSSVTSFSMETYEYFRLQLFLSPNCFFLQKQLFYLARVTFSPLMDVFNSKNFLFYLLEKQVSIINFLYHTDLCSRDPSRDFQDETTVKVRRNETLRNIKGLTLRDRIRSDEIRAECNVIDVARWVRTRMRNWRDHVDRMGQD
jgi:hypothetical protein